MACRLQDSAVKTSHLPTITLEDARQRNWDAVIVGGGMGGAAAAYRLIEFGLSVLLIEKGLANPPATGSDGRERQSLGPATTDLHDHGRWDEPICSVIDGRVSNLTPLLGCGVGGSTLLYAATLGRLDPADFEQAALPDGRSGCWPFDYADLEPYYLMVERLFHVSGTPDPLHKAARYELHPPPPMNESDRYLFSTMTAAGLHPYRVHLSMKFSEDCSECGGHFCPKDCKGDARSRLVVPASRTGRLFILDRTEVRGVDVKGGVAQAVKVNIEGVDHSIEGRVIVLAAGALMTPKLLLNSRCVDWPDGLGNNHGQVGRNLMFHASDLIAVWPKRGLSRKGPRRSIALRDFYAPNGLKLGELQSMGLTAGYGDILTYLLLRFGQSRLRRLSWLKHLLRIPAFFGAKILKEATVFATIVEDYPYRENRVLTDAEAPSGVRFEYRIADELRERVLIMRRKMREAFRDHRVLQMTYDVSLNLGHPCGTCRAGDDPADSVVDMECRVHEISNLYIADGSIMPTSGGTNPSLTIAANAIRVADKIAERSTRKHGASFRAVSKTEHGP